MIVTLAVLTSDNVSVKMYVAWWQIFWDGPHRGDRKVRFYCMYVRIYEYISFLLVQWDFIMYKHFYVSVDASSKFSGAQTHVYM